MTHSPDWKSLRYAVVDVEGNGHQPPDLVELAVVPITAGHVGEPLNWLVKPEHPIVSFATRIHGLTNADVADAPAFADVAGQVRASLEADAVVAHNAPVDLGVLRRQLAPWQHPEVFDTLTLARRLRPRLAGYRLGALTEAFHLAEGLSEGLHPHRATYDALVAARLFVHLATHLDGTPLTLAELRGGKAGGGDETPALF